MLRRVALPVDRLQRQRLLVAQELYAGFGEPLADARAKTDCLLFASLANLSLPVSDCRLQQHLEAVVEQDEYGLGSPPVPRAIEVLDREHQ